MMTEIEVQELVQKAFPNAAVAVSDMTGSMDHFEIHVVSGVFKGKLLVEQHQMVQKAVKPALEDGRIHAIAIKTFTPERWEKARPSEDGLFQIG